MSDITTPFDAVVEMQRDSIKQSQALFQRGLAIQQNAFETFMYNGITAQRQAVALFYGLFNAQLDAGESAMDDEAFRDALNSQFDDFERSQQRAWSEFESELGETFEELSERQQDLVAETVENALTAQREAQADTAKPVRAAETVTEDVSDEADAVAEMTQQQIAKDVRTTADSEQSDDVRLEDIEGLGRTAADQLRGNSIQSVGALAEADTAAVADAAEVAVDRAHEWVTSAQTLAQPHSSQSH